MAEFGRMGFYDFSSSTPQQRAKYIRDWAKGELGKSAGTDKFSHMMDGVRIGHEGKHYDESKSVPARNFDELSDVLFSDEAQVEAYEMTPKETTTVVERAVREVQTVSTFIDAGRATYAIIAGIFDNAMDVGNWLTYGGNKSAEFQVDFDDVFCGSGMINRPTGYVMGEMFPEMSTHIARVVLQKDRLSQHFFRAHTAFPDLAEQREPTGRFLDKEIEKAIESESLSNTVKGYWRLSLCGYQLDFFRHRDGREGMSCTFEYQGTKYSVQMNESSWTYPNPYMKMQLPDGTWTKTSIHNVPQAVAKEALQIHDIMSGGPKQLTNIREGILREPGDLAKNEHNQEDISQE